MSKSLPHGSQPIAHVALGEFFDPRAELFIHERLRPHWSQAGAIAFVTFRTHDSIPRDVLRLWDRQKNDWLRRQGLQHFSHWSQVLHHLDSRTRAQFNRQFDRCREDFLDTCHGRCLLKQPELAAVVAEALMHFDKVRYRMGDFVIMPNHVHLLAAFPTAETMEKQFDSWLHYSAYRINQVIGEKGHFWQQEPFDHLVRSLAQYEHLRQYLADNPRKAKLREGQYHYRRMD